MRSSCFIPVLGLTVQSLSLSAWGQSPETDQQGRFVVGSSSCPTATEVVRETLRLTPLNKQDVYASNVRVTLEDLGNSYRLQILAPPLRAEKTYIDPGRDCARRARFAAVLVVLTLMPPQVAADEETASVDVPEVEPAKATPVVAPLVPAKRSWFRADLGIALRWSPPVFEGPALLSPGVLVHGSLGPGRWGGYFAAGYFRNTEFELQGITAQIQRSPLALGVAFTTAQGVVSLTYELGVVASFSRVTGSGLLIPKTHSTLEWGAQAGGHVTLGRNRVMPIGGLTIDVFPSPNALAVAPRGHLGTTSVLELTTYVGGRIGF